MKKWKLWVCVMLVLALVSVCLVGCGDDDNYTDTQLKVIFTLHETAGTGSESTLDVTLYEGGTLARQKYQADHFVCTGVADANGTRLFDMDTYTWIINVFDPAFLSRYPHTGNTYLVDLYVQWTAQQVSVLLKDNAQAGLPTEPTLLLNYGADLPANLDIPAAPDSDHEFVGWYNYDRAITDKNGVVTNRALVDANYTLDGNNLVLTPHFDYRQAQVSFQIGLSNVDDEVKTFPYGHVLTAEDYPTVAEVSGQELVGWSISRDYDQPYEDAIRQDVLTLYARWKAYKDINFYDGEEKTLIGTERVYQGDNSIQYPATKIGRSLDGWYDNPDLSGNPVRAINYYTVGTLYARWLLNTYTVTFATGTDQTVADMRYQYGETKEIAPIERDGYTFDGWYLDIGTDTQQLCANTQGKTEDLVLTAKWTPCTYTVNCYKDSSLYRAVTVTYAQSFQLPVPTQIGYTFTQWTRKVDNVDVPFTDANGNSLADWALTADLDVQANWSQDTYTITFISDTDDQVPSIQYHYLDNYTFAELSRDGYAFEGWVSQNGGDNAPILQSTQGLAQNLTLVPSWTPERYLVRCFVDDVEYKSVMVSYGAAYDWGIAVKTGYNFDGWYVSAAEDAVAYTDNVGKSINNWSQLVDTSITVYAHFTINTYQVKYQTNGGTSVKAQTYTHGTPLAFPTDPVNAGYFFDGWYTDANLSQVCSDGTPVTQDLTLYARWAEGKYINTADDLRAIADNPNMYYKLARDINLEGAEWTPIAMFGGTLNGDGHKIYNYAQNTAAAAMAFVITNNGTIKNITFDDMTVINTFSTGAVKTAVVACDNNGRLEKVSVTNATVSGATEFVNTSEKMWVGGLIASNGQNASVLNCTVEWISTVSMYTSGIATGISTSCFVGAIAVNDGYIGNCSATSTLSANIMVQWSWGDSFWGRNSIGYQRLGGIAGRNNPTGVIENSTANVDWDIIFNNKESSGHSSQERFVGGVVGINQGVVRNVKAAGKIKENCSGENITSLNYGFGGIVGWQDQGSVNTCVSSVSLTATNSETHGCVGGIVGYLGESTSVTNAYFDGSITGTNVYAIGGLVGKNEGNCVSSVSKPASMNLSGDRRGILVGQITNKGVANKVLYYGAVEDKAVGDNAGILQKEYRIDVSTAYTYLTAAEMYDKSILSRDIWGLEEGKSVYLLAFAE